MSEDLENLCVACSTPIAHPRTTCPDDFCAGVEDGVGRVRQRLRERAQKIREKAARDSDAGEMVHRMWKYAAQVLDEEADRFHDRSRT